MSAKRNAQTAAKRAREQTMREKRERKAAKKLAVIEARNNPEPLIDELEDGETDAAEGELEAGPVPAELAV